MSAERHGEEGTAADEAACILHARCDRATDGAIESLGILTALRSHNDDYGERYSHFEALEVRCSQFTPSPSRSRRHQTQKAPRRHLPFPFHRRRRSRFLSHLFPLA